MIQTSRNRPFLLNDPVIGFPQATLTSAPVEGTLCQRVQMVCMVYDIQSLNWYFDGTVINTYTYNRGDTYPRTTYNQNGVHIEMTLATPRSSVSDNFNGTSTLNATIVALNLLGVDTIRCGTNAARSQEVDFMALNVVGNGTITPPMYGNYN